MKYDATLAEIAAVLRDAGVLPKDAENEALEDLARKVVREMQTAEDGLRGLGTRQSGKGAVDESTYLAKLLSTDRSRLPGEEGILALFTRKVRDKVFLLRQGVWVDRAYAEEKHAADKKTVEAFSDEYFDLMAAEPGLRSYLAFSARLIVLLDNKVYEIVPGED